MLDQNFPTNMEASAMAGKHRPATNCDCRLGIKSSGCTNGLLLIRYHAKGCKQRVHRQKLPIKDDVMHMMCSFSFFAGPRSLEGIRQECFET